MYSVPVEYIPPLLSQFLDGAPRVHVPLTSHLDQSVNQSEAVNKDNN